MLRILTRIRKPTPNLLQLPTTPPPARPPAAGPRAANRFIFNIPRLRVVARLESLGAYLPHDAFLVAQYLVDYLPNHAFHHLHIDRALMTLKNGLVESHRHFKTDEPLEVFFPNSRKGRKQVDLLLDQVLHALFDNEVVDHVYRVSGGCFNSHLKPKNSF